MAKLTKAKARTILRHGSVKGKKLTQKQKGFFGRHAGGVSGAAGRRKRKRS